jgi:hypothetical protein
LFVVVTVDSSVSFEGGGTGFFAGDGESGIVVATASSLVRYAALGRASIARPPDDAPKPRRRESRMIGFSSSAIASPTDFS